MVNRERKLEMGAESRKKEGRVREIRKEERKKGRG